MNESRVELRGVPFETPAVNNITTNTFTDANGNTSYTPAILHMEPGEKQFWRVSNSTSDTILDLQVQYDTVPQTFQVVAVDGVAVNSQDGTVPGGLIAGTLAAAGVMMEFADIKCAVVRRKLYRW